MKKKRGFEVISSYAKKGIHIPERKTSRSSGYDLEAAKDTVIQPHDLTRVYTGLKVYMPEDEYLLISIRSSLAFKKGLILANGPAIIDSDYYNNEDNEGHLIIGIYNPGDNPVLIKKWDRIAQGIFMKYKTTDDDTATGKRVGGIGSTGK